MSNYTEFVTSSGEKLLVKRVPRNILSRFAQRLPAAPRPPKVKIVNSDGVEIESENREDAAWQASVEAANADRNIKLAMFAVHMGVRLPKERREQITEDVTELRERARTAGVDVHPDDETAYIWEFCLEDPADLSKLTALMYASNHPTQEAVAAHVDTFPGDVPGATAEPDPNAGG
jgi:hypothetical protein